MSKREEHIHYLRVLRAHGSVYQLEIREALGYAIGKLIAYSKNKNKENRMKRGRIFGVIVGERNFQDAQQKGGRFQTEVHSVGAELTLMKVYLDKAMAEYARDFGDASALHGIRKVAALAVRCMENHGALPRELMSLEVLDIAEEVKKEKEEKEEEDEVPF